MADIPTTFSESSNRVLALLKNARKMAIIRQDRRLAASVLHACALYVKETNFPCDPAIFDRLAVSVVDKNNSALLEAFARVEKEMSDSVSGADRREWKTIRLPR